MQYKLFIILLIFFCGNAESKVDIYVDKLLQHFKVNNIEAIYENTSKIKNADKSTSKQDLKLYKTIYVAAINNFSEANDHLKLYDIASDIYKSNIFNVDKEFTLKILVKVSSSLDKNNNCRQKSKFIINLFENGISESDKTYSDGKIIIDHFIKSSMSDYESNAECLVNYFEKFLEIENKKIIQSKRYKITNAVLVTNLIFKSIGELQQEPSLIYYENIVNNFIFNLFEKNKDSDAIYFMASIQPSISQYYLEIMILNYEKRIIKFNKYSTDDELINRVKLLSKYLRDEHWPFQVSREKVINDLIDLKISNKIIKDFLLVSISEPAIRILKSKNTNNSIKYYNRILLISPDIGSKIFKTSFRQDIFKFLVSGFKLRASLAMGDLQTASKIHDDNFDKLIEFFNDSKKYKDEKFTNPDELIVLLKPLLEYEIFMRKNDLAEKIINAAISVQNMDISKIGNREYLFENKKIFTGKNSNFLYMLQDYYEFSKNQNSLEDVREAIILLIPGAYNYSSIYFRGLNNAINYENKSWLELYLGIFKRNLINYRHDSAYSIFLDTYEIYSEGLKSFPEKNDSEEFKLLWRKNIFEKLHENLGLYYFLENSKLSYLDKITILRDLFKFWQLNRNEEAYVYAKIYLSIVKHGFNSINSSSISNDFKESQSEQIEEIIQFFYDTDNLIDAKNAISIFKEQRFLEFLDKQGQTMRGLDFNLQESNESSISIKIKSITAELDLVNQRIDSEVNQGNLFKLNKLRLALTNELKNSYNLSKVTSSPIKSLNKVIYNIEDGHAYIDYFLKNGKLNIIYNDKNTVTKITKDVDTKLLSKSIQDLHSSYLDLNENAIKISASVVYENLFLPIELMLIEEKIVNLHIRANSFLASVPLKYLIGFKNSYLNTLNVIYQGVHSPENKNFKFDARASLFATTKKFGDLPPLTFADTEVEYIYSTYKSKFLTKNGSRKFINKDFSFQNLASEFASNSNVIHIASHYSTSRRDGGLLLGTGQLVSPKQIWNQLSYSPTGKLVTLSACESGLFNDEGQSMEDLPNVFLNKGAIFVVATLWKISDSATADFMRFFYDLLMISGDPPSALNLTQSSFAEGNFSKIEVSFKLDNEFKLKHQSVLKKYSKPFFWAGFQLISSR